MSKACIRIIATILFGLSTPSLQSTVVIQGDDTTSPNGFTKPVTAQAFDRRTGTFFVGLDSGAGAYAISKALAPSFRTTEKFTGIATDTEAPANGASIEFLALLPQPDYSNIVAYVVKESNPFEATKVNAMCDDGTKDAPSSELNDASGTNNSTTFGIVNIAASSSHIFAAVRPSGNVGGDNFGDEDSGIALLCVNNNTNECATGVCNFTLNVKDATTGVDGNKAVKLDQTSDEITGGTDIVTFPAGIDDINLNKVAMFFDETFDRLYIGVRIQIESPIDDEEEDVPDNIGKAVVVGRLNNSCLKLVPIVTNDAITDADEIVVAKNPVDDNGDPIDLRVKHIRVMHTSAGPSYLIINGGRGETTEVCNRIRALPLVDNPQNPDLHGTLAKKDECPNNFVFTVPATAPGHLPIEGKPPVIEDEPPVMVGQTNLPIDDSDEISDMVVVGDTVYVSINKKMSNDNDTGIFYSQALCDNKGKIVRWTPWTKRTVPFNAFPGKKLPCDVEHDGRIKFFAVDAKTGNIWIVEGTTERVVGVTSWTTKSTANNLITRLNMVLANGSYSVLDLDQSTRGFTGDDSTVHRYALFGGVNKVVFARISESKVIPSSINSPQTVIDDFSSEQNLRESTLPACAGCAQVMEYSRKETDNFFFAGTENGLFVFAKSNGDGFNADELSTLDESPFRDGKWTQAPGIAGSVIDIKTSGRRLYALTFEFTKCPPCTLKSTLYSIGFAANKETMFASNNMNIIAQTGVDPFDGVTFDGVTIFTGIQIIATGDASMNATAPNKEQLVLATNQGLFRSNANQSGANGIIDAINPTQAKWQFFDQPSKTMFTGIGGIDTPIRHTVWPISVADEKNCLTFERSNIHQLCAAGDGNNALFSDDFIPDPFNAKDAPPAFKTLDPITYFWSDGARRFFIFNRLQDPSTQTKLAVIPFDIKEWNVTAPAILRHPTLDLIERFFWVRAIGASGLVLAGTESGVVGLE